MNAMDIILVVVLAVAAVVAGLYFLNKWATKKQGEQQEVVDRTRQITTIYVIDKKKDKAANVNLPKVAMTQLPKIYKYIKMPFVKAKIGPQIITLMCDAKVFKALPVKKSVKVGLAGIYIVDMPGMKTAKEMKAMKDKKKAKDEKPKGVQGIVSNVKDRFKK